MWSYWAREAALSVFWVHRLQPKNLAVAWQRMPLFSRVTVQKGGEDNESKPLGHEQLKKPASPSFTFTERTSLLQMSPWARAGRKEHSREGGFVFVWDTQAVALSETEKFIF